LSLFVSGASGYIGGAITRAAAMRGMAVWGGIRSARALPPGVEPVVTGDLADAHYTLPPADIIIHAAGLGHRRGVAPETWRRQNARASGAKRFILISTAYIHGRVHAGPVTDTTAPTPMDDYARSKLDAELETEAAFGPGFAAIRPTAVIGPGCPGNVQLLLRCLRRGLPLPFGAIRNRRSFIPVADLAALALTLARAEAMPARVLAAHPETISTPALVRALAEGLGVRAWLPPFPPALLGLAAAALGRRAMWQSLSGDFAAEPRAALALGWKPEQNLVDSLRETSRYYDTTTKTP
jgi:nucleoside-diphosphate-sugar epimerase